MMFRRDPPQRNTEYFKTQTWSYPFGLLQPSLKEVTMIMMMMRTRMRRMASHHGQAPIRQKKREVRDEEGRALTDSTGNPKGLYQKVLTFTPQLLQRVSHALTADFHLVW